MKNLVKISALAVVALMAVSCCNNDKQDEFPPEGCPSEQMRAIDEKWVKFEELSEAEQKALITEKKALIDSMEARRKAAFEKMKADWENFDSLSIDEQKRLLDMKSHHFRGDKPCNKGPKHCCKKGCPDDPRPDGPRPNGPRPEK